MSRIQVRKNDLVVLDLDLSTLLVHLGLGAPPALMGLLPPYEIHTTIFAGDPKLQITELETVITEPEEPEERNADVKVNEELLSWAVQRWNLEVKNRPLVNVHRRALDDTWRQVMRYAGGNPDALVGPDQMMFFPTWATALSPAELCFIGLFSLAL